MKKTIKKNLSPLLLCAVLLLVIASCKKNKDDEPTESASAPTGTYMLHLHTYIDATEVDAYNIVYTNGDGRQVSLSMAQVYLSAFQLVKLDGSVVEIPAKKILKTFDTETYFIGSVPVGNYKSIRFKVGLDSVTNQLNETTPSDSALLNKPAMWFGGTAQPDGYVFMNVSGSIDTTANATGTTAQMQPFVFKIGTNANYTQVNMPDKNFSILKDQVEFGHILIDYNKLFNGITLNQNTNLSVTTAGQNSSAPATIVAGNIASMFIYE